ncbi:MAG: PPOX class F420-dependent oxidoreductase [Acidimicrobiales bacterium]
MAERPTVPDSHRPLLEAEVATLATVGPDGRPQLSEVWFLADGEDPGTVRLSLNRTRQKTRNLEARPVCSLLILDLDNPYRYLELRGAVEVVDDPDLALADRVGEKYHADLRQHDRPGERRVAVTLHPDRVHAVDMSAA